MATRSLVWVWELTVGVRSAPVDADKGRGKTIWVVGFPSNFVICGSNALTFSKLPFAVGDKCLSSRLKTKKEVVRSQTGVPKGYSKDKLVTCGNTLKPGSE